MSTRTWRGHMARVQFYFQEGSTALQQGKQVLYVCAALKLLDVPIMIVILTAPLVYVGHVVAGYIWIHYAWYKQTQEVPMLEATNPVAIWQTYALITILNHLHLTTHGVDLTTMPKELQTIWTSMKRPT